MNCTVRDIAEILERWAPRASAEEWDNVGLTAGRGESPVETVLIALDVDEAVLNHACQIGAGLIVSHHPVVFKPTPSVNDQTVAGRLLLTAIESGIALFAAHTNLDRAAGGVNDALCAVLGLAARPAGEERIGRLAELPRAMELGCWAAEVSRMLGAPGLRVVGPADRMVRSVYVLAGAGRVELDDAIACGADVFLTGELGYHDGQKALYSGLAVVEAGHFHTEAPVLNAIEKHLQSTLSALQYNVRTVIWEQSTCPFWVVDRGK